MNARPVTVMLACLLSALGAGHHDPHVAPVAQEVLCAALSQRFAREMDVGMRKMMNDMHAPGYTGNPDVDFLAMMIPHHEGAVEVARLVLIHGPDWIFRSIYDHCRTYYEEGCEAELEMCAILREKIRLVEP